MGNTEIMVLTVMVVVVLALIMRARGKRVGQAGKDKLSTKPTGTTKQK